MSGSHFFPPSISDCMLITKLIKFLDSEAFPLNSLQDSTNSVRQTEKATSGEAAICSGGGQDQKGTVCVTDMALAIKRQYWGVF